MLNACLTIGLSLWPAWVLAGAGQSDGLDAWPADARHGQEVLEDTLLEAVDPQRLRNWHDILASEPHEAGTPGDDRVVENLASAFADMGLEVERHAFWAYLPRPVRAELHIVAPETLALRIAERPLAADPFSAVAGLSFGWNAFSGSGDVTAEVVYAHRGRRQDFARLEELGVSCRGKIVVARYGGNYRGFKAKFAEAAGAAGLIMFTDPADSGYGRGLMYPEGGFANADYIQRGSIKTLPYQGDPLTPFVEATENAERLDPASVALPKIPVQPVGWAAAREIMSRMCGPGVPQDWQGGLPFRYRLAGGPQLKVRLHVEQDRRVRRSHNVLATLRGRSHPDERIIVGCHHDAWAFGASDPACGMMTVLETARVLADAARRGHRPERSITFAAWGAEEYGIIGSVEWVEGHLAALQRGGVAYINLDMAAMGLDFRASASPTLQRLVAAAGRRVPAAGANSGMVIDDWLENSVHEADPLLPRFGSLGGGSDHVGFMALAGVPCISMGAGGAQGTSYHSIYDTLTWYRQVVGDDYVSAQLVTRMAAVTVTRLANAPLLPIDVAWTGVEVQRHLQDLTRRGRDNGLFGETHDDIAVPLVRVAAAATQFRHRARDVQRQLERGAASGRLAGQALHHANTMLRRMDRVWLHDAGLTGRPWYRNLYAAPDEDSGYAAWLLPALRRAIEHRDAAGLHAAERLYLDVFERLNALLDELAAVVPDAD